MPSFTTAADGLLADPVNLVLVGTLDQLRAAFAAIGWVEADKLTLASSWRMAKAFVLNRPYPAAPFSTLFLFGRGQDIGFQKAIGDSPRKRHHVRFWGRSLDSYEDVDTASFWLNTDVPPPGADVPWVGAGTRDTGFGLASLTFQITHATDKDTNAEREYIIGELRDADAIGEVVWEKTGDRVDGKHVNRYITDGDVAVAALGAGAKLPSRIDHSALRHGFDVDELDVRIALLHPVQAEHRRRHVDVVAFRILGDGRAVGLDEARQLRRILRRDPAQHLARGLLEADRQAVLVRQPVAEHVELQRADDADDGLACRRAARTAAPRLPRPSPSARP